MLPQWDPQAWKEKETDRVYLNKEEQALEEKAPTIEEPHTPEEEPPPPPPIEDDKPDPTPYQPVFPTKQPQKKELDTSLWFYPNVTRSQAEQILLSCRVNVLLVRKSSMEGCYAVSTYDCSTPNNHFIVHYLVVPESGGYRIEETMGNGLTQHSSLIEFQRIPKCIRTWLP